MVVKFDANKTVVNKAIRALLAHWQCSERTAKLLLGNERERELRIQQLLSIHKALRVLYPKNPELLYGWINMRNSDFGGRTPIDLMTSGGEGMNIVLKRLNSSIQR